VCRRVSGSGGRQAPALRLCCIDYSPNPLVMKIRMVGSHVRSSELREFHGKNADLAVPHQVREPLNDAML
jgi:hypothetical protein